MAKPIVSVCVATYNQDEYIQDCLVSVLAQTFDYEIEVLIGDDGTSPKTPVIVEILQVKYPGRIRYFRHPQNLGASKNYQFLIQEAQGEFLAHLDGDDLWLPGKIKAQLEWLKEHPESIACYTNAVLVGDSGEVMGVFSSHISQMIDLPFILSKGNFLNHSSLVYRATHKSIILNFMNPFIDYQIHLHFARCGQLGFINAAYVVYRQGSTHSMIKNSPGLVIDLYFNAIVSVLNDSCISIKLSEISLINFLSAIFVEGLVKWRIKWVFEWINKVQVYYSGIFFIIIIKSIFMASYIFLRIASERLSMRIFKQVSLKVLHEI